MSNDMKNGKPQTTNHEKNNGRRKILRTIAGAGGAIAAGGMLPEKWTRPMVDAALLPAHAQTSSCTEPCTLSVSIDWDSTSSDMDLLLETPGGTLIDPKATTQSQCLRHEGDDLGNRYEEFISTIGTGVNPGTYRLSIRNNDYGAAFRYSVTGCNIDITGSDSAARNQTVLVETFTVPGP